MTGISRIVCGCSYQSFISEKEFQEKHGLNESFGEELLSNLFEQIKPVLLRLRQCQVVKKTEYWKNTHTQTIFEKHKAIIAFRLNRNHSTEKSKLFSEKS